MTAYFLLTSPYPDLKALTVFEDPPVVRGFSWRLSSGRAAADRWPDDVRYRGDASGGTRPRDLIGNSLQIMIASATLQAVLADLGDAVEWLPVELETPRGRRLPESFFIANPLVLCDALDPERSEVEDLSIIPGQYSGLFRMRLRHTAIPAELRLFRLAAMPSAVVVREDLKAKIEAAGITGVRFIAEGDPCEVY